MAAKLSENMSKLIHRMGGEREDRLFSGETKLTVAVIFLIDDNWRIFEIAPMLDLAPSTDFRLNASVGFRFFLW